MTTWCRSSPISPAIRQPAVAGAFYPAVSAALSELIGSLVDPAGRIAVGTDGGDPPVVPTLGLLLPHAGLVYSGVIAAAGLREVGSTPPDPALTVVVLGTNHSASC